MSPLFLEILHLNTKNQSDCFLPGQQLFSECLMVDIARVFSPVVVLEGGEARPKTSDRIRTASAKRLPSADTHRIQRISSAVSTIESDNSSHGRFITNQKSDEKDSEVELREALTTPLTGVNILGLIHEKISQLDQTFRSGDGPSDTKKHKALAISEKLRADAIRNGQSRQEIQQFAGILAVKSTFQDQIKATLKPKEENVSGQVEQDQSTLLEIFKYPGFDEHRVTPLPFKIALERQVMRHILSKQYTLSQHAPHIKPLIELYYSAPTKALILDIFWWIFLENYQNKPEIQKKLLSRAANSYVALLMIEIDLRYRDKCFQVYPSLLAETVFACFKVCFPGSIKRMPIDAEAASKTKKENENIPSDIGNSSDTSDQRMKELVNLDKFKNSISNICQLWLGGIPTPPHRYEQWRSKIVQQEKISFTASTPSTSSITGSTTTTSVPHTSLTIQPSLLGPVLNDTKHPNIGNDLSNSLQISSERNKQKEPHERLKEMYKHTADPLPDRRVLFEDYRFNLNGNSPLTEKFLRSSHMLKKAGTQLFISHPQISQVPTTSGETYDNEIKRTAQFCRILRAQRHQIRDEEQHHRQIVKQHVAKLKAKDDLQKQEKQASIYTRRIMNLRSDEIETMSQISFKSHE